MTQKIRDCLQLQKYQHMTAQNMLDNICWNMVETYEKELGHNFYADFDGNYDDDGAIEMLKWRDQKLALKMARTKRSLYES